MAESARPELTVCVRLRSEIEGRLFTELLHEEEIPFRERHYRDTAFDGLGPILHNKVGWGEVWVAAEDQERVESLLEELRSSADAIAADTAAEEEDESGDAAGPPAGAEAASASDEAGPSGDERPGEDASTSAGGEGGEEAAGGAAEEEDDDGPTLPPVVDHATDAKSTRSRQRALTIVLVIAFAIVVVVVIAILVGDRDPCEGIADPVEKTACEELKQLEKAKKPTERGWPFN